MVIGDKVTVTPARGAFRLLRFSSAGQFQHGAASRWHTPSPSQGVIAATLSTARPLKGLLRPLLGLCGSPALPLQSQGQDSGGKPLQGCEGSACAWGLPVRGS